MATAYSYIRFSSKQQAEGDSERRQLERTKQYCSENKLTLSDKTYADLGISAFKEKNRPSLTDMLEAIKNNFIKSGDYIILENLDRLSRRGINPTQLVINEILEKGVNLVSLQDGLELNEGSQNDLISVIRIAVSADLAHKESEKKSTRLKAVWGKKQSDASELKKPKTTQCPAWLKLSKDRTKYVANAEKVKLVQEIFEMLGSGIGRKKIAYILNNEKRPHISDYTRTTGIWYPSYIEKIMSSHAVLGHFIPSIESNGKRVLDYSQKVENYFPRIIDDELFYKVKKIREGNSKSQGRKGVAYTNLLQGISYCRHCNRKMMYVNKGRRDKYLQCSQFSMGLCDNNILYRYKLLEFAVVDLISSLEFHHYLEAPTPTDYSKRIEEQKVQIEKQQEELDYYISLDHTIPIRNQISKLNSELSNSDQVLRDLIKNQTDEKALELDVNIDFNELVSGIIDGDIKIRSKANNFLRRKCKLVFNNIDDVDFCLHSNVLNSDSYISCARLALNRAELTAFMNASEDAAEEAIFHLKEFEHGIVKNKR